MIRIDGNTVELSQNEQWISERTEELLDRGMGVVDAVVDAMMEFLRRYPMALDYPLHAPYSREFIVYMMGGVDVARQWAASEGFELHTAEIHRFLARRAEVANG